MRNLRSLLHLPTPLVGAALALSVCSAAVADTGNLPPPTAPQGWGVNIHFTDPAPGEMDRFAEGGFGFARMDFVWDRVEKTKGVYDFAPYDRLWETLRRAGCRPLFILDYGNALYQQGSPSTPEARAAFARFAAAAAKRFAGKGVVWEIWNEPNGGFWKPQPDPKAYAALAIQTAKAVHAADPKATVLAPGSAGFPWDYFETVFQAGLLDAVDGVSVHPYRGQAPETAAGDFARLRGLIARYAPAAKRNMPIVTSEWGYTTRNGGTPEALQGAYLGREWLADMASGVDLTIFYDWRDDGDDPNEGEHRFGTVRRAAPYPPKPSFTVAKALTTALRGYTFRHRLAPRDRYDWRLLFQRGDTDDLAVVSWSDNTAAPIAAQTPAVAKPARTDPDFAGLRRLARLHVVVGPLAEREGVPAALTVSADIPGASGRLGLTVGGPDGRRLEIRGSNAALAKPRAVTLPVSPLRSDTPPVTLAWTLDGQPLPATAPVTIVRLDPLTVAAAPDGDRLRVTVENPSGAPFAGTASVAGPPGTASAGYTPVKLTLARGQRSVDVALPSPGGALHRVVLRDSRGRIAAETPLRRFVPFKPFPAAPAAGSGWSGVLFSENAPRPAVPLAAVAAPAGGPGGSPTAVRFDLDFPDGWQYAEASPPESAAPIPKGAAALAVWVWSDAPTGDALRCRVKDATGQTHQPDLGRIDWKGWRLVTIPLDGSGPAGHWGGANDGVPHPPLTWEGLLLVDSVSRKAHRGRILLAAPVYEVAGGA